MEITYEQYEKLKPYLPKQRGNDTIYTRMNRWSKNGVLDRIPAALQKDGIININVEVLCLDGTTVKVPPDACGALKKTENRQSGDHAVD